MTWASLQSDAPVQISFPSSWQSSSGLTSIYSEILEAERSSMLAKE